MHSEDLNSEILADYDRQAKLLDDFRVITEALLREFVRQACLHIHSITSRLKNRASLAAKITRINKSYSSLAEITDIVGIRVITNFEDEVNAVGQLIERHFFVDQNRSIDKRQIQVLNPDRFGYLSLHYVCSMSIERVALPEYKRFEGLTCEIQVRSMLQHAWAEVEHDLGYKAGAIIPAQKRRRFSRLAGLLEIADSEFISLRQELQDYATEIQSAILVKPNEVSLDDVSLKKFVETDLTLMALERRMADSVGANLELLQLDNLAAQLRFSGIDTIGKLAVELQKHQDLLWQLWQTRVHGESKATLGRGIGLFYLFQVLTVLHGGAEELNAAFEKFKIGWSAIRRARAASTIADSILAIKNKLNSS